VIKNNFKKISTFIENNIVGCKFVGTSSDAELFIEFEHDDDSLKLNAAELLRAEFPEIAKVIFVERPNIGQVKQMIDDLNNFLKDSDEKKSPTKLLDIESF
jgi:hypothetical protein